MNMHTEHQKLVADFVRAVTQFIPVDAIAARDTGKALTKAAGGHWREHFNPALDRPQGCFIIQTKFDV